jgi:hypothetical protein
MSNFVPGQRVICIDGRFHPSVWEYVNDVPIEGQVYTVRSVRHGGRDNVTGKIGPAICLKEISGRLPGVDSEVAWIVRRFAPLDLQESTSATREKKPRPKRKAAPALQPLPTAN